MYRLPRRLKLVQNQAAVNVSGQLVVIDAEAREAWLGGGRETGELTDVVDPGDGADDGADDGDIVGQLSTPRLGS